MPGKKFKSIGIREKLYNRIEEEKKEEESISDYIERLIDISTIRPIQPYEAIGDTNEAIEGLRRDIALYIDGKELVTSDKEGLTKEGLREVLRERKEQGNITTTDINAGITIEDLKRELINVEIETVDKIKAKIEELKYV